MNVALEKLCLDKGWYLKPEAAKIAIIGDLGTKTRTTGVLQIRNIEIWEAYEFQKQRVRKDLEGRADVPAVTNGLASQVCSWMLIHGTTQDKVDEIASFGFERLARESGLYGQGIYFTDRCKSFQYPCEAQGPLRNLKVDPLVDERNPNKGRCHSVIAKPRTPNGGGQQVHREFVLFNGARAYPEMIVYFETSSDPWDPLQTKVWWQRQHSEPIAKVAVVIVTLVKLIEVQVIFAIDAWIPWLGKLISWVRFVQKYGGGDEDVGRRWNADAPAFEGIGWVPTTVMVRDPRSNWVNIRNWYRQMGFANPAITDRDLF